MKRERTLRDLRRACQRLMDEVGYEPVDDKEVRRAMENVSYFVYEITQLEDL